MYLLIEPYAWRLACTVLRGRRGSNPSDLPDRQQTNVAAATSILAGLVLEKDIIRGILREEIMQESVIYQDIKAQGKAEGKAEGIKEGEISLVLRLLKKRIGEISAEDESQIINLSVEQLEALGEALLDFSSGDDFTAWLNQNI